MVSPYWKERIEREHKERKNYCHKHMCYFDKEKGCGCCNMFVKVGLDMPNSNKSKLQEHDEKEFNETIESLSVQKASKGGDLDGRR